MFVLVGLGNPGREYENTRHNAGRTLISYIHDAWDFPEWRFDSKAKAQVAEKSIEKEKTTLLLPDTFMNKSGNAVARYVKSIKAAQNLIVVHDEIDMPLGTMKFSFGRGDGGHNGVASVMRALKTKDFVRLRIGVSPKTAKGVAKKPVGEEKVVKFLLGKFSPDETKLLKKTYKEGVEALRLAISEGYTVAMNTYN